MSRPSSVDLQPPLYLTSNIIFMFLGGLLILCSVIMVIVFDDSMNRIKKFARLFAFLFRQRRLLTPRIKVRNGDEQTPNEISNIFNV